MLGANPRMTAIAALAYLIIAIIGRFALSGVGGAGLVLTIVLALLLVYILWTFRAWLESKGFNAVSMFLLIVILLTVVQAVLEVLGLGMGGSMASADAIGTGIIVWALVLILTQITWLLIGIKILPFSATGGGIWKAYGILLIIAAGVMLVGAALLLVGGLTKSLGLIATGGVLIGIGALVFFVVWIIFIIAMFKAT